MGITITAPRSRVTRSTYSMPQIKQGKPADGHLATVSLMIFRWTEAGVSFHTRRELSRRAKYHDMNKDKLKTGIFSNATFVQERIS